MLIGELELVVGEELMRYAGVDAVAGEPMSTDEDYGYGGDE